ncbi:phage/plasmid primase, P4 family, C-terminal domain-containing protein [Desulfonatronum zhilinae]|nr:phage/plasmid primase, P4 family, C-terminal domain-containing protein [Desulfonatronum zhilinae]
MAKSKSQQSGLFGYEYEQRMKGLMKLPKLKTIANLAAMGKDGLTYKRSNDEKKMLIAFNNVVYDFRAGGDRKGRPSDYIFKKVNHDYDPSAPVPKRFLRYLKSIFKFTEPKPRREFNKKHKDYKELLARYILEHKDWFRRKKEHESSMIGFMQVLLGYILAGSGNERVFLIFWGPEGNNGKTTLMNIFCSIFGDYAVSIDPNVLLSKKMDTSAGAHSSHILDWEDRRFLFADETESGKKLDTGFVKRITGNGFLIARGAHEKEMSRFAQTFTVILLTNNRPHIPSDDSASWRRTLIIPFYWSFVNEPDPSKPNQLPIDKNLLEDLKDEYPGIIKWVIDGAEIYRQKQCLDIPECVKNATLGYKNESDIYLQFIMSCLEPDTDCRLKARSVYNVFLKWCHANNHQKVSEKKFSAQMIRLNLEKGSTNQYNTYDRVKFNSVMIDELFEDKDEAKGFKEYIPLHKEPETQSKAGESRDLAAEDAFDV